MDYRQNPHRFTNACGDPITNYERDKNGDPVIVATVGDDGRFFCTGPFQGYVIADDWNIFLSLLHKQLFGFSTPPEECTYTLKIAPSIYAENYWPFRRIIGRAYASLLTLP